MAQPMVIKVGGALLQSVSGQKALFDTVAQLMAQGTAVVIVHGGGCLVEDWLSDAGLVSEKLDGLRITPKNQIELVAGALAGAANKNLVASAKTNDLNAVGLSLSDGNMVSADYVSSALGQVGKCVANEHKLINILLESNYLPIISSIADDGHGQLLNVNADQAAQAIAQLLQAKLVLLSDVPGVLDANQQLISQLDMAQAQKLMSEGVIKDGMKVKVEAAFATAQLLADSIVIASWQQPQQLLALADSKSCGTTIKYQRS